MGNCKGDHWETARETSINPHRGPMDNRKGANWTLTDTDEHRKGDQWKTAEGNNGKLQRGTNNKPQRRAMENRKEDQ